MKTRVITVLYCLTSFDLILILIFFLLSQFSFSKSEVLFSFYCLKMFNCSFFLVSVFIVVFVIYAVWRAHVRDRI